MWASAFYDQTSTVKEQAVKKYAVDWYSWKPWKRHSDVYMMCLYQTSISNGILCNIEREIGLAEWKDYWYFWGTLWNILWTAKGRGGDGANGYLNKWTQEFSVKSQMITLKLS